VVGADADRPIESTVMSARVQTRRALAALPAVLLVAACSTAAVSSLTPSGAPASRGPTPIPTPETLADYPGGFSTSFVDTKDPGNAGLKPVDGGLQGRSSGSLRADNGTTGTYTSTWVENRVAAAKVVCGGTTYKDVFVGETPEVTTEVDFADWGHAVLTTVGNVVVYRSSRNGSSPALCEESTGGTFTFVFTNDPIERHLNGSWHWDEAGRLVFDPPSSESPSPSQGAG
jgi:hypothetical protein